MICDAIQSSANPNFQQLFNEFMKSRERSPSSSPQSQCPPRKKASCHRKRSSSSSPDTARLRNRHRSRRSHSRSCKDADVRAASDHRRSRSRSPPARRRSTRSENRHQNTRRSRSCDRRTLLVAAEETSLKIRIRSRTEVIEGAALLQTFKRVEEIAEQERQAYLSSSEFRLWVESMKQREREAAMQRIQADVELETTRMMEQAREAARQAMSAEQVLLENRRKIEEKQRRDVEERELAAAQRLEEIRRKRSADSQQQYGIDRDHADRDSGNGSGGGSDGVISTSEIFSNTDESGANGHGVHNGRPAPSCFQPFKMRRPFL